LRLGLVSGAVRTGGEAEAGAAHRLQACVTVAELHLKALITTWTTLLPLFRVFGYEPARL
jgi:hypothetical protein